MVKMDSLEAFYGQTIGLILKKKNQPNKDVIWLNAKQAIQKTAMLLLLNFMKIIKHFTRKVQIMQYMMLRTGDQSSVLKLFANVSQLNEVAD